jgi:signal transduction histidine kinase
MVREMSSSLDGGASGEAGRLLALGSMVPGVVHELNNALLGLLGMLELAQADAAPPVAERLAIAQLAGDEIRDIARVLGALARESVGETATLDARELAREVAEASRTLNLVRGLELVEVYAPEPAPIAGAVAEVRQAMLLLIGAAFTGSGREGPLLLEVGPDGERARISVRHSGAGSPDGADAGLAHVAAWARARGGELAVERARVTFWLPLAG